MCLRLMVLLRGRLQILCIPANWWMRVVCVCAYVPEEVVRIGNSIYPCPEGTWVTTGFFSENVVDKWEKFGGKC